MQFALRMKLRQERHQHEHVAPNGACLLIETMFYKRDAPTALKAEQFLNRARLLPRCCARRAHGRVVEANVYICSSELARWLVSAIIRHADGPSEKRSRFYSTRAARERDYAKHARNPKPFSFRQPDLGHAVHCRARAQRFSRSACAQGARLDYAGAKSSHH